MIWKTHSFFCGFLLTTGVSAVHTIIVGLQPMANRKNLLLTILIFAFLLGSAGVMGQKTYFVYLQSDNQQPFYINIRGKNISSSAIGYVIIPKLVDSTYPVKIGFNSGVPVQEFDIVVNGNDQGFIIKDFGEKGFGLFNLQSLAVQMNVNGASKQKEELAREEKRVKDSLAAEALIVAEKQKADSIKLASEQEAKKKAGDSAALANTGDNKQATGAGIVVAGATVAGTAVNNSTTQTSGPAVDASKTTSPVVVAPVAADISKSSDSSKNDIVAIDSSIVKDTSVSTAGDTSLSIARDSMTTTKTIDSTTVVAREEKRVVTDSSAIVNSSVSPPPVGAVVTGAAVAGGAAVAKTAETGKPNFLDMEIGGDSMQADTKALVTDSVKSGTISIDSTHKNPAVSDSVVVSTNKKDSTVKTGAQSIPQTSSATGTITMNTPNASVAAPVAAAAAGVAVASEKANMVTNTSCKKIAGDKDFFAVRKKMVASDDEAQMILAAKSAFKEKCYTNEQLRNLCVLFLDDASRYRFLDEAYAYSTDPQSYKQLGDLLKDEYYNRRFMAMLK
jgi:hypothetical protein